MNNKHMANKILLTVLLLFGLTVWLRHSYPEYLAVRLCHTILEAALVGGIADWFAITALFRRPLGFPWHTALIPRNRQRVIAAVRGMVETELLSAETIKARITQANFVSLLIAWFDHAGSRRFLQENLERCGKEFISQVDPTMAAAYLEKMLKQQLRQADLAVMAGAALRWAVREGKSDAVISLICREVLQILQQPGSKIRLLQYLEQFKEQRAQSFWEKAILWLAEQTDSVNMEDAAEALYQEIVATLEGMQRSDHPLRCWLREKISEAAGRSPEEWPWRAALEEWKQALLLRADFSVILAGIIASLISRTAEEAHVPLISWLTGQVEQQWLRFKQDEVMQDWVEVRLKQAVFQLVESEHHLLGEIVEMVLGSFSDEDLNSFIESKAGEDLQWIRINGSVVGGMVGALLFIFMHYVYDPYLLRWLQG